MEELRLICRYFFIFRFLLEKYFILCVVIFELHFITFVFFSSFKREKYWNLFDEFV
jgi:hypothetical protein